MSTGTGKIEIAVPRDRAGSFDPQLIAKYRRRFPGFDDKIISMYARGLSTREIAEHLPEIYGIDASAELISTITDAVLDEVTTWQQRPLGPVYPVEVQSYAVVQDRGRSCRSGNYAAKPNHQRPRHAPVSEVMYRAGAPPAAACRC